MKTLKMLAVICVIGALVFTFAACGNTTEPTTEPTVETTEATEATEYTIPVETFQAFIGTWYADGSSAGNRIVVNENAAWEMRDADGTTQYSGNLVVTEKNVSATLYDPDGVQVMDIKIEQDGSLTAEFYVDVLTENLVTNKFLNVVTNNESHGEAVVEESSTSETPDEEVSAPDNSVIEENTESTNTEETEEAN